MVRGGNITDMSNMARQLLVLGISPFPGGALSPGARQP